MRNEDHGNHGAPLPTVTRREEVCVFVSALPLLFAGRSDSTQPFRADRRTVKNDGFKCFVSRTREFLSICYFFALISFYFLFLAEIHLLQQTNSSARIILLRHWSTTTIPATWYAPTVALSSVTVWSIRPASGARLATNQAGRIHPVSVAPIQYYKIWPRLYNLLPTALSVCMYQRVTHIIVTIYSFFDSAQSFLLPQNGHHNAQANVRLRHDRHHGGTHQCTGDDREPC